MNRFRSDVGKSRFRSARAPELVRRGLLLVSARCQLQSDCNNGRPPERHGRQPSRCARWKRTSRSTRPHAGDGPHWRRCYIAAEHIRPVCPGMNLVLLDVRVAWPRSAPHTGDEPSLIHAGDEGTASAPMQGDEPLVIQLSRLCAEQPGDELTRASGRVPSAHPPRVNRG